MQKAQNELNNYMEKKKQHEEFMQNEKLNEYKYKGSFDIKHEERLYKLKNYMNLLSEKVDLNMDKYIIYNNQLSDKVSSQPNSNNNSNPGSPLKNYNYVSNSIDNLNERISQNNLDKKIIEKYNSYNNNCNPLQFNS